MADKAIIMKDWIDKIIDDPYVETSPLEVGCILYAACQYWWTGQMTNIGEVFGNEYTSLNRSMANIYGQIDRVSNFKKEESQANIKYDAEQIRDLRLEGHTAKEICEILGYPVEKAKSLSSNKGWIEASKILKQKNTENTESVQICTENIIQKKEKSVQKVQKNTDSVQKIQKDKDLKTESIQKKIEGAIFEF